MKRIKVIDTFDCGHSYEKYTLLVPDDMDNIIHKHPRPCMTCVNAGLPL